MNAELPALSLRQPWAWAIFHAGKNIENRTWATKHRGRIRIHAALTWDAEGSAWLKQHGADPPLKFILSRAGQLGAYVGEVTVTNCHYLWQLQQLTGDHRLPSEYARWAFGPVCWELHAPEAYPEPIPGRGYPGLYLPERFTKEKP